MKQNSNSKRKHNNTSGFANTTEVKRRKVKHLNLESEYDTDLLNEKKKVRVNLFGTYVASEPVTFGFISLRHISHLCRVSLKTHQNSVH